MAAEEIEITTLLEEAEEKDEYLLAVQGGYLHRFKYNSPCERVGLFEDNLDTLATAEDPGCIDYTKAKPQNRFVLLLFEDSFLTADCMTTPDPLPKSATVEGTFESTDDEAKVPWQGSICVDGLR